VRRFFAWLERHGACTALARDFAPACAKEEEEALRAEGIVEGAGLADRWECPEIGCARLVVKTDDGYVAACTREEGLCETVTLSREDLRQVKVSLEALLAIVRRELRVEEPRRAAREGIEPLYVGEQGAAHPRDVFLELHPRAPSLPAFLALREHAPRPTVLLVPSLSTLSSELVTAHATGAKVEIDALDDALHVRGGRVRAAPRLRSAKPPPRASAAADDRRAEPASTLVPRARRWADLCILAIDKHTILVKVGLRRQRLTAVDLGLAGKNSRKATKVWTVLLLICAGSGEFRWNELGTFENAKVHVTKLRHALSAAFGIDDDPFHDFTYEQGWRARFQAGMWSAEQENAAPDRPAWSADSGDGETDGGAESAWAVAFDDWQGKAPPAKATRAPRDD
jgi:hypothetical protein